MPENQLPETPRQVAARRNGAKSKGPVTPEGKDKSSRNATKHGLFALPKPILSTECEESYEALLAAQVAKYQPADTEEEHLVVTYVISRWRLQRLWLMEAAAVNMHLIDVDGERPETGPRWTDAQMTFIAFDRAWRASAFFANMGVYEARLRRAAERAKRQLDAILAKRSAVEPAENIRKNEPAVVAPTLPGSARNRPCPCGSGQKYKRCCLLSPPLPAEPHPKAA